MLSVENLHVTYGGIRAVRGISLDVGQAETVALVGPNGAGKSSTLRAIMGFVPRQRGEVRFGGVPLPRSTEDIVRAGLTLTPEGRRVFPELTVSENLKLGGSSQAPRDRHRELDRLFDMFPILFERRDMQAGVLSGGEQQQLAIARSLMSRPRFLLLDEPSLGLAPQMTDFILSLVGKLRADGLGVLMVEQNVQAALAHCDRLYVMVGGRIVQESKASEIAHAADLAHVYFGTDTAQEAP